MWYVIVTRIIILLMKNCRGMMTLGVTLVSKGRILRMFEIEGCCKLLDTIDGPIATSF